MLTSSYDTTISLKTDPGIMLGAKTDSEKYEKSSYMDQPTVVLGQAFDSNLAAF